MRIIVMSDSHGNYRRVEQIVKKNRAQADCFIHLGDGLHEVELLLEGDPELPIFCVRGNCDWGNPMPQAKKSFLRSFGPVKIFYTHGDLYGVKYQLDTLVRAGQEADAQVILYGHTHVARIDYLEGIYVLNPGSCSMPRNGEPSYLALDITEQGIVPVLRPIKSAW